MQTISFIEQYSIVTQGNESPPVYHKWCALSGLSHFTGRRIWCNQGVFHVRPNVYIILVGPPGIAKTSAMTPVKDLLRKLKPTYIAPAAVTKEALLKTMCEEKSPCIQEFLDPDSGKKTKFSQVSIFANEIAVLLQTGNDAIGYINILTDIWDQDIFEVKTLGRGLDYIELPFISILGCMTPEVTASLVNERILSGGFSRRCIFVSADRGGPPVPRPTVTPEQAIAKELCLKRAAEIRQLVGEVTFSLEAGEFYDNWYRKNHARIQDANSVALTGSLRSKGEYVIKLAMLLSIDSSNDLIMHTEHVKTAIQLLDEVEPNVDTIFAGTGRNELASVTENVYKMINLAADVAPYYVTLKTLKKAFYKDVTKITDLDGILNYLIQVDRIIKLTITEDAQPRVIYAVPRARDKLSL
jgi:hypothetical protein